MKLCINCKHNVRELWCQAPANGTSPVDGKPQVVFASVARGASVMGYCGPEADNFVPVQIEVPGGFSAAFKKIFLEIGIGK